jgi:uncharacterized membrane protein
MKVTLEIVSLLVVGWIAGAETGSWCCVQPLVPRLPYEQQVALEQGMLGTFGRIMPVLMPLSAVLAIVLAVVSRSERKAVLWLRIAAVICIAVTTLTTLMVNVPINSRTAEWQLSADRAEWDQMRAQWHFFQGVRGILFLMAFVLLALAMTLSRSASIIKEKQQMVAFQHDQAQRRA